MCHLENTAALGNRLVGALIGLARATDGNEHLISESSTAVIVDALTAGNGDAAALEGLLRRVEEEKRKMVPDCFVCAAPCGKNSDYDMKLLWNDPEDIRNLKSLLLLAIRSMAGSGCADTDSQRFLYKALIAIGVEDWSVEELLPIALKAGEINLRCMTVPGRSKAPEPE